MVVVVAVVHSKDRLLIDFRGRKGKIKAYFSHTSDTGYQMGNETKENEVGKRKRRKTVVKRILTDRYP